MQRGNTAREINLTCISIAASLLAGVVKPCTICLAIVQTPFVKFAT
jgi:hypothetical protein